MEFAGDLLGVFDFQFSAGEDIHGDSGSTVLGFSVAFLGMDFISAHSDGSAARSLLFPFLIAGWPLLDALAVVLRRLMKGRSPFRGDRGHFYDYLLGAGWTARSVAISCYLLTGLLGVLGSFAVLGCGGL